MYQRPSAASTVFAVATRIIHGMIDKEDESRWNQSGLGNELEFELFVDRPATTKPRIDLDRRRPVMHYDAPQDVVQYFGRESVGPLRIDSQQRIHEGFDLVVGLGWDELYGDVGKEGELLSDMFLVLMAGSRFIAKEIPLVYCYDYYRLGEGEEEKKGRTD